MLEKSPREGRLWVKTLTEWKKREQRASHWPLVQTTSSGWRCCSRGWGRWSGRTEQEDCGTSAVILTLLTHWTPSQRTYSVSGVYCWQQDDRPAQSWCSRRQNIQDPEEQTQHFILITSQSRCLNLNTANNRVSKLQQWAGRTCRRVLVEVQLWMDCSELWLRSGYLKIW